MNEKHPPNYPASAETPSPAGLLETQITRRRFLFLSAAAVTTVTLSQVMPGSLFQAEVASYEGARIGSLSGLRAGQPQEFRYPWDDPNCVNYLVKLGVPAGGGIGPEQDVVAFNTLCPHMGMPLVGQYHADSQVLGPCPLHLSTYDLTRHGMVVAGHATQGLPQILLETREDDIYAVGVMALIYGFADNEADPAQA